MNYGEKVPSVLCCLLLSLIMGCNLPFSPAPPLTTAEARHTLDHWNPNYCSVPLGQVVVVLFQRIGLSDIQLMRFVSA